MKRRGECRGSGSGSDSPRNAVGEAVRGVMVDEDKEDEAEFIGRR